MAILTEWYVQLMDVRTGLPLTDGSSFGAWVAISPGTATKLTIYGDERGSAKSNPAVFVDGVARFWTDVTVLTLDLSLLTNRGCARFVRGLTPNDHRVAVDNEQATQTLIQPWAATAAGETTLAMALPAGLRIDPWRLALKITTADSGKTIDFGTLVGESGGDPNGLIAAASCTSLGWLNLLGNLTAGTGAYLGALLLTQSSSFVPQSYVTNGTAKTLCFTGSSGITTAAGLLVIGYDRLAI